MRFLFLVSFLLFLFQTSAFAFPELTVHGYVNCTACHVSPNGGGTLTEYGRGLSKELLSAAGKEGEEKFLYGLLKTPEWLQMGGDVRLIQTYLNNARTRRGDFFLMQADIAPAIQWGKLTVAGAVGIKGGPDSVKDKNQFYSRNHYLMYQAAETISVRAGRFMPQYGIMEANHTVVTRQNLGFGEDQETYNLEGAWLGERADLFVTAIAGRPDDKNLHRERGGAVSSSFNFAEKNKVGANFFHGISDRARRSLAGVWGIFALTKEIYWMTELDHQWRSPREGAAPSTSGPAAYQRIGYEIMQGLQVYGTHQLSYLDHTQVSSRIDAFGPGVDFFPRPHLEVRAEFLRERMMQASKDYFDTAWLLLHYYF